jgi:hypothetical protein
VPVYGTGVLYGAPAVYGFGVETGSTLDDWRKVYGGFAPWLPDNRTAWRQRCVQVGTLDTDRRWVAPLAGFSTGGERQLANGVLLPEDNLTIEIADPLGDYLGQGDNAALVAPNALLGLRWTVTTPAGSLTRDEQPYRISANPRPTRDRAGRDVLRVQAEDWNRAGQSVSDSIVRVVDEICLEYLFLTTYERDGVATALDTTARRVTVQLLPVQGAAGSTVAAAYGQPAFAANDVGKRVRVWERVERRLDAGRPVIVSRSYTLDTILGGQ